MPRLNRVIEVLEQGKIAVVPFAAVGSIPDAYWAATSPYDGVVFDLEHNPFNPGDLRLSLQFMLNRQQIVESGTLAPVVAPFVRIPANGREHNNWVIKQVLDIGVYGIIYPMINTVDDAWHALKASRYIQAKDAPDKEPIGIRGNFPLNAARYWGLSMVDYYDRADVWPLDPQGEILPILQCETEEGVLNLRSILREVKKPGLFLISEGDLSVSLGYKGQPHPEVDAAVEEAVKICREFGVLCGSPQVNERNLEQRIAQGFNLLMPATPRDTSFVGLVHRLNGR
ncbi:MAG: aldolase [Chloroflexi bacterium]|nr:aldolase [Chloroflexota bacterium]MBI3734445.1 aldolase [Chloroflexota bacterium]